VNSSEILGLLVKLARCLQHWRTLKEGRQGNAAVDLIDGRMERLERDLADAGIDLDYWTMIDPEFTGTDQHAAELFLVAREGRFQLHAIAQEIRRRWKDLSWNDSATVAAVQGLLAAIDADD